jgi:flagellar basal-body rod protein FlgF/flagellar basal-body rod protein FlgG
MYTRDGSFQVSSNGQLTTASGDPVMGAGGPLTLPPGEVSISADGTISSRGAVAGKVKVVEFKPGTTLTSAGETYYSVPPDSEAATTESSVKQGMLESSNVNPVTSMVELITAQRSAEMMQHALTMFNSEMDKTATQDLPKVS